MPRMQTLRRCDRNKRFNKITAILPALVKNCIRRRNSAARDPAKTTSTELYQLCVSHVHESALIVYAGQVCAFRDFCRVLLRFDVVCNDVDVVVDPGRLLEPFALADF